MPDTLDTVYTTREAWLLGLTDAIRPWYEELGLTVPDVRVSVGFSSKGSRSKVIGECWHGESADDGQPQVFIHPGLDTPEGVAATVVHELIHAALGPGKKHGPAFKAPAVALGLEGRMTATVPGDALLDRLRPVLLDLGPYPHARLLSGGARTDGPPKQSTRMRKAECSTCGYLVRTTQKWLDVATPTCPVDLIEMEVS
jgi:hypothetical protein